MRKNDSIYLRHILDSIERIEEYTGGMEKEDFSSSSLVQDGTIRQIEIIGKPLKTYPKISAKSILKFPGGTLLG